jgi:DNA relaxase NicK
VCAEEGSFAPPATNRGVHWTIGGIDWLQATLWNESPGVVTETIAPGLPWIRTKGLNGYHESYLGPMGIRVLFTEGREDIHVQLPGRWHGVIGSAGQREILEWLHARAASFTRIDLQLTDERRVASPDDVWNALNERQTVTRVKRWERIERGGDGRGTSVYVGSKASLQRLIVYDKAAETDDVVPGVRWELRVHKEAADSLAVQLLASDNWGDVWAGRLINFVDFRENPDEPNSAGRSRMEWFAQLVQGAERMRAYAPHAVRTLEDVQRWLRKQVAPSLATVVSAAGGDIAPLLELASEGAHRMTAIHRAMAMNDDSGA